MQERVRSMKKVGFIGLGDMGIYMSHILMKAGYPVNGYDMNEARVQQFAMEVRPAEAAQRSLKTRILFL